MVEEEEEEEDGATRVRFISVDVVLETFLLFVSVDEDADEEVDERFRCLDVASLRRPMTILNWIVFIIYEIKKRV